MAGLCGGQAAERAVTRQIKFQLLPGGLEQDVVSSGDRPLLWRDYAAGFLKCWMPQAR